MKHLLHKLSSLRLLMLLTVLFGMGSSTAWAQSLTFDFEDDEAHRTEGSNSYTGTNEYSENGVDIILTYADAVTTGSPINGTANAMGRVAKNTTNSPTIVIGPINNEGYRITGISCQVYGPSTVSMAIHTSTDNSNWTSQQSPTLLTGATIERGVSNLDITSSTVYLKFTLSVASKTSSNRDTKIDDIVITREATTPAYTITAVSSNNEYGTVSLTGTIITATPEDGYRVVAGDGGYTVTSGTATVTNNGDNTFSVTPTSDCTVRINFEALPTYTVSFSDGGSVTEVSAGAGVTLPSREDIDDYEFVGWSEENVPSKTTDVPTIIPVGAYNPTGNITLYPVYTVTEGGSGAPSAFEVGDTGNFAIVSAEQGGNYYALPTTPTVTSGKITAQAITVSEAGGVKYVTTANASGFTWTIASATNGYTLSDGSKYIYHSNGGASGTNLAYGTSTDFTWAFTIDGDYVTMAAMNGSTTNNRGMLFNGTTIGGYALSNAEASGYYKIMILPIANAGTTYYWSAPVAAAVARPEIAVENNPFLFSTTATITCETEGAAIKYSYDGETWNDYSSALTITETKTIYAKAVKNEDVSEVAEVTVTKNLAIPTVTVSGDLTLDLNGETDVNAGTLTASVIYNETPVGGATVTWSSSAPAVATINETTGVVTLLTAGEVTFTATYAGNSDYAEKTDTKTVTVFDSMEKGGAKNPYTVAEAIEATPASGTSANVYIRGVVSQFYNTSIVGDGTNYRYYISDDGTTATQLLVYKGKKNSTDDFSSADDLLVGDVVTIYGGLTTYYGTKEVAANNYIVTLVRKTTPGLAWSEASFTATNGEENTYPTLTNTNGVSVTYSSTDEAVATINASTGVIALVANGTTTIKATFAGDEDYLAQEVSYELTVQGFSKDAAGISFSEDSYEFVYNDDDYLAFEGQVLTNPNSLVVVWSSDDDDVALVDENTGEVVLGKPGTATITATFTEDEDYFGSVVSYTITINKAEAGLSFDGTSFMVAPNGDFTEPTFNNPNSLAVAWASTDEDVAYVDGGEVLIGSKEGTATITASFAGNDYYNAGNASYTITVSKILLQTWNLSTNSYSSASETEVVWTSPNVTMIATKYNSNTATNNYLGGDAKKRTSSRFYTNSKLTITPASGYQISSVEFTATSEGYASTLANSSDWTNAAAAASSTTVTVTPVYGSKAFEAVIGGTCGFTSVTVTYQPQTQEDVVIGTAGYTSYTTEFDVNFDGTGVTAYIATAVNSETIHLESVTEAPAGTALIIQADPETYPLNHNCEGTTDLSSNLLKSSDGSVAGDGTNIYALGVGKEAPYEGVVGFYVVNSGQTVPAGKAYLDLSGSSVKEFLTFDFDADAINTVQGSGFKVQDSEIFNLAGQKMNRLQKGINIVNGKKVLVK